jgi:hypothetical protein
MRRSMLTGAILGAALAVVPTAYANAQEFHAKFSGFFEIGALGSETGAILSNGEGTLKLKLDKQLQSITFTLTYTGMATAVQQAHIHFGKVHVAGGIIAFLCSNLPSPPTPSGTQPCPANGGTVTGTLTPTSVIGPTAQNFNPGNFAGLVDALQSHTAYGNIHTQQFPAGEIRGEIRRGKGDDGRGKENDD